jgi:hypothetical protein
MAGLLRQAHGCESRASVFGEGLEARQLPVSNVEEPSHWCIEGDPAPSTAQPNSPHRGDKISGVVPLIRHHDPVVGLLFDLPKPRGACLRATLWAAQDRRDDFRVRVNLVVERRRSPAFQRSYQLRTISTFSRNIARPSIRFGGLPPLYCFVRGINVSSLARCWRLRSRSCADPGAPPRACCTIRTTCRVPPHQQRATEDPWEDAEPSR